LFPKSGLTDCKSVSKESSLTRPFDASKSAENRACYTVTELITVSLRS
jgi:hypothetical protein